jgi:DNA-binding GntR family transcriptional regulator
MTTDARPLSVLPKATSRSDLVASSLREAILAGQLKPGDLLVERRIAEMLGVSKTPVREALIALVSSGLVIMNPTRGAMVRSLSTVDVRQIYEVRMLLEPWAVARTAQNRPGGQIEQARRALAEAERHLGAEDHEDLSRCNRRFHRALYSGCGNPHVVSELDELQDLTALGTVNVLWERWPTWRAEFDEHQRLLAAVESGDAAAAEEQARAHIERNVLRLIEADENGQPVPPSD